MAEDKAIRLSVRIPLNKVSDGLLNLLNKFENKSDLVHKSLEFYLKYHDVSEPLNIFLISKKVDRMLFLIENGQFIQEIKNINELPVAKEENDDLDDDLVFMMGGQC